MARLIDANALLEEIQFRRPVIDTETKIVADCVGIARKAIVNAPTVDAVEVVRCKDCKYYREGAIFKDIKFCFRLRGDNGKPVGYNFSEDDFCSYGERREGE